MSPQPPLFRSPLDGTSQASGSQSASSIAWIVKHATRLLNYRGIECESSLRSGFARCVSDMAASELPSRKPLTGKLALIAQDTRQRGHCQCRLGIVHLNGGSRRQCAPVAVVTPQCLMLSVCEQKPGKFLDKKKHLSNSNRNRPRTINGWPPKEIRGLLFVKRARIRCRGGRADTR
jgi:hypothetical protein